MLIVPVIILGILYQTIWTWHCISEYRKNRKKYASDPRKFYFLSDAARDWKETKEAILYPGTFIVLLIITAVAIF
jgi:hypothetical protein